MDDLSNTLFHGQDCHVTRSGWIGELRDVAVEEHHQAGNGWKEVGGPGAGKEVEVGVEQFLCRFFLRSPKGQDKQGVILGKKTFLIVNRTGIATTHAGKSSRPPWLETGVVQPS